MVHTCRHLGDQWPLGARECGKALTARDIGSLTQWAYKWLKPPARIESTAGEDFSEAPELCREGSNSPKCLGPFEGEGKLHRQVLWNSASLAGSREIVATQILNTHTHTHQKKGFQKGSNASIRVVKGLCISRQASQPEQTKS